MNANRTIRALVSITDEGLFERLATTILREANPLYESLVQTGINADGKTVKAPLDGICYVSGARPPHLIAVHHTTSARNGLKRKWLYDPDAATLPDKSKKSSTPPGDFIKTAKIVAQERKEVPDLQATLVLTTNRDPSETVIREVEDARRAHDIEIDLWSCSRLAHFLDNSPVGHWIRRQFLQIEQELLSPELLHELSRKSLEVNHPLDNAKAWIPRALDEALALSLYRDVTFVVACTGQGKTVACYRRLVSHVQAGGFGLVLSDDVVASATTLDQAIADALRRLHPTLASDEETALSICSPERPLLLVVEDINRADRTQFLAEKIAKWSRTQAETEDKNNWETKWHLLCPLWPETFALLGDQARKSIEPLLVFAGGFSENEGREAILARARLISNELSPLSGLSISKSLGHDLLLIALYDFDNTPDPGQVIGQFVDTSLSRTVGADRDHLPAEYRKALRLLAEGMLSHRQIDPHWLDVRDWEDVQGEPLRLISRIAHVGELIRLMGPTENQRLMFRHDRVRDWLLADAVGELERRNALRNCIVTEPYYAEVMGTVLSSNSLGSNFLRRVAEANPLALFHALRLFGDATQTSILQAIDSWLDNPATHDPSNLHLRLEALAMLEETDSHRVPAIVRKFPDQAFSGQFARLRNGDTIGGIELCMILAPGIDDPWRDIQIEHAKLRHGAKLSSDLDQFLRRNDLNGEIRLGALRLAGHIGDPSLSYAIEACWNIDDETLNHLAEYLWAFGQCCGNEPARFLGPVCDAWAALPDDSEREGEPSPRDNLAAYELRFAFSRWPPHTAIDYFVQRAVHDDLKWPITFMLHSIDHPKALEFVAQELAAIRRRLKGTKSFSPFVRTAADEWQRAQEQGRPMSDESRKLLLSLWQDDENDNFLRMAAFSLWAATKQDDDLKVLLIASLPEQLAERVLAQRLARGDKQAIPAMIGKLSGTNYSEYWWQYGRYLWAPELTDELDRFLDNRGEQAKRVWLEFCDADPITSELIIRLPTKDAERLLLKHWKHLRFSSHFVQAALYVATKPLLEVAYAAIEDCPKPAGLMMHLGMRFGIKVKGHPGLNRENQVLALAPYLDLLEDLSISMLWEECNNRGWFATRKKLLDSQLQSRLAQRIWNRDCAIKELDSMVEEDRQYWIDHWIDQHMKADVSWSEILTTLMVWLDARQSLEALEVVTSAVAYRGERKDISLLRTYKGMKEDGVKELILDTEFAVQRRTLS